MTPATYKLNSHYRGDTFSGVRFTLKNKLTEVPISLTGATIKSEFRRETMTGPVVETVTSGNGITVENAALGIFRIDSMIIDWDPGVYHYDVQVSFSSEDVRTYIKGTITVTQDVTR